MKIGQVVKKYGIPADSIYFYIKSGLLVPQRKNGQYIFDERTVEDLEWILKMKEMEFPLKGIHRILSLKRVSNLSTNEDKLELVEILEAQNEELHREQMRLEESRQKIRKAASEWRQKMVFVAEESGFPIAMLGLLACPRCGGELGLSGVMMNQKAIFQADLQCACGYRAAIRDGILETGQVNESLYDKPDTTRELYKDLPSETLSLFEQSYRWLESRVAAPEHHGKIWLEGHVNAWFFFHNHLKLLKPEDGLIVTDKFPETLRSYRKVMEHQGIPCPVMYLADAKEELPLKKEAVDRIMDFFGTNEHSFYSPEFYPDRMFPYLKRNAEIFGVYFSFKNGTKSIEALLREYPECNRSNFNIRWFREHLQKNYHILENDNCGFSRNSGKNLGLGFHVPGEELHLTAWHAEVKK
ncbi:MAG: MerR family transcriptional regulator [Clostridium sp.]|nr:MerR family transcriptional regulator [Clostridium sp.]